MQPEPSLSTLLKAASNSSSEYTFIPKMKHINTTINYRYLPRAFTRLDLKMLGGPRAVIPKNDIFSIQTN